MTVRVISVIGATGSVGTQARDVVRLHRDRFRVAGLAAGSDLGELAAQAIEFGAVAVGLARPPAELTGAEAEAAVRAALASASARLGLPDRVESIRLGETAAAEIAALEADVVLNAVTGAAGLDPTLAALEQGTDVALANKESLIIGGPVVLEAAADSGAALIPVDSEHSAIWQALRAGRAGEVAKLVVTASGGPFRGFTRAQLESVTPEQALAHPTWDMGRVITTNSASLVNKGLEVIEAHLLFGVPIEDIEVVVHPQSQVHSMVQFTDGSTLAQVSPPDMRLPIAYALGAALGGAEGPERLSSGAMANDWTRAAQWTFEPVDHEAFPALGLAIAAGARGGTHPAVLNAANEVLVDSFHEGLLPFTGIAEGIAAALEEHALAEHAREEAAGAVPLTRETVLAADARARAFAGAWAADRSAAGIRAETRTGGAARA
ncbi:1-deoxy-D-xylulose-5-phosphate reductoisomerase [Brevibacterium album]|uniref:1-deoxy-D-xylulose-5-phosphate reductoisomerase n=1 Tax=Brevibacterium album TaxID=417948 RepID=UPI000412FE2A|nr:1-deoxy-D-xylulose-5-phosphate reductoisomerase [Brevibacterium album]